MKDRNAYKIAIVGTWHLFELTNETNLTDYYYVLPIKTYLKNDKAILDFIEEDKFCKNSEEIVQINLKILDKTRLSSIMTNNMLCNRLTTLHQRQLSTKNLSMSPKY